MAQQLLADIATDLLAIEDRLRAVRDGLPRSRHEDAMLEGRQPMDLATSLLGLIDCALVDQIRPAVEALEQAARLPDPP
jgi:hypothetical protein